MRLKLTIPLPPTLNDQIDAARRNKYASSGMKKRHTKRVADLCKKHNVKPFPGAVWIVLQWKVRNFGRDGDNIEAAQKFIIDGLRWAGVIRNDNLMNTQSVKVHLFARGGDEVDVIISSSPVFQLIELPDPDGEVQKIRMESKNEQSRINRSL